MAEIHGKNIVTDGLVLHLDAANPQSYDGNSNIWRDLSGNNNHTTINAGLFFDKRFISVVSPGYASLLEFSTPDSSSLYNAFSKTTGGWTIEEHILINDMTYPEAPAGTVISSNAYSINQIGFDWNHGNSFGLTHITMGASNNSDGTNGYDVQDRIQVPSHLQTYGVWMQRSLFWDRTNNVMGAYVNGVYCGSINISVLSGKPLYDGSGINWGVIYGWGHDGARWGMKIYNRLLTSEEILQNYNATKNRYI